MDMNSPDLAEMQDVLSIGLSDMEVDENPARNLVGANPARNLHIPGLGYDPSDKDMIDTYLARLAHQDEELLHHMIFVDINNVLPWELPGANLLDPGDEWKLYFLGCRQFHDSTQAGRVIRTGPFGQWKTYKFAKKIITERYDAIVRRFIFLPNQEYKRVENSTNWLMDEYAFDWASNRDKEHAIYKVWFRKPKRNEEWKLPWHNF